ncbi:putative tat pathway signal sequence protein [Cladophialophora carrionii]|uniref:Putative tat pathway signal sequence protein n=1 Tax=Cladophialophora carrionii TaxID=86049 RepID=A0A1C1CHB0_9EURO|nr:putative tat pathway signal sequence protein [Cladophialophora carrionii]
MKTTYSVNALKRWSCKSKNLPSDTSTIKNIHVYDFDNTLFCSPLPNPLVWHYQTIGLLQTYETLAFGGWWHDNSILAATGEGLEKEELRAWEGHWNETVRELVELSIASKDTITVLLTGRGETNFADLVNRICNSRKLDFDLVALKPEVGPSGQRFDSTMSFKQEFLKELVFTYQSADEIRIYEDRPKHVKAFKEFFERLNKSFLSHRVDEPPPPRKPINAEVIHVCELKSLLNPDTEIEVVQRAIARHNEAISSGAPTMTKTLRKHLKIDEHFSYFGYMINQTDSARLLTLFQIRPDLIDNGEVRLLASSILICPFYPRNDILKKVGGRGHKVTWQVTGIAKHGDSIWAARVAPVNETKIYTQDPTPVVVLAIRKGARQIDANKITQWQDVPPDKAFMFVTTVADKVMLKIEDDHSYQQHHRGGRKPFRANDGNTSHKRKFDDSNFKNKESYARGAAGGSDRDEHVQRGGRFAQRNAQSKANFNNRNNPNVAGNRATNQGANANARQRGPASGAGGSNRGGRGGGGAAGGGGNRGPPAYKSLDDYPPGNFDGANDSKTGTAEMVMNY